MSTDTIVTGPSTVDTIPVSGLSIYDPVFFGMDKFGQRVEIPLIWRNMLKAGEPGAGKSVGEQNIVAHGMLSSDCSTWLFDGKLVELGMWADAADVFVGPDMRLAILRLTQLQFELDRRYVELKRQNRRK